MAQALPWLVATAGVCGVFLLAFVGPCDPSTGYETDFGASWTAVWLLSAAAIGAAPATRVLLLTWDSDDGPRVVRSVVYFLSVGGVALLGSLILWINVCENVRLHGLD